MAEVKLHGFWYSPFTLRVVWTLKLTGIPYKNIEEDRFNKSPQLLQYNPVHKKIPVLVHAGKPICESMIIVEYIDEIWPQNSLLPVDPCERAQARFWVKYADDVIPAVVELFRSSGGEEQEKSIEKIWEHLRVVEEQCFGYEKKLLENGVWFYNKEDDTKENAQSPRRVRTLGFRFDSPPPISPRRLDATGVTGESPSGYNGEPWFGLHTLNQAYRQW